MNTEILGVALQILLLLVISYPLGKHIAKVYKDGNDCMRFMAPIERFIYKLAGINPNVLLGYDPVGIARISSFES